MKLLRSRSAYLDRLRACRNELGLAVFPSAGRQTRVGRPGQAAMSTRPKIRALGHSSQSLASLRQSLPLPVSALARLYAASKPLGDQLRRREGLFCITVTFVAASTPSRMPQFVCENSSESPAVENGGGTGSLALRRLRDKRTDRVALHFAEGDQSVAGRMGDTEDFRSRPQRAGGGNGAMSGEVHHYYLLKGVRRGNVSPQAPLQFETLAGDKTLRLFFHLRSDLTGWSGFELEHYGNRGSGCGKRRKCTNSDQAKSLAHFSLGRRSSRLIICNRPAPLSNGR